MVMCHVVTAMIPEEKTMRQLQRIVQPEIVRIKQTDNFLVTDCIGTEKMVSSEYNTNVFRFGEPSVRKLLADLGRGTESCRDVI